MKTPPPPFLQGRVQAKNNQIQFLKLLPHIPLNKKRVLSNSHIYCYFLPTLLAITPIPPITPIININHQKVLKNPIRSPNTNIQIIIVTIKSYKLFIIYAQHYSICYFVLSSIMATSPSIQGSFATISFFIHSNNSLISF